MLLILKYFQAEYLADAEEFELHSPSLTAFKWWPGGLGRTATHAVVMAQLTTQVLKSLNLRFLRKYNL